MKKSDKTKKSPDKEPEIVTLAQHNADMKRYVGAMTEHFEDVVRGAVEGLTVSRDSLNRKIDAIQADLTELEEISLGKVEYAEFSALDKRVSVLEKD